MARAKRDDERLLSKDEQTLVTQTRHPTVKELAKNDLLEVVKLLREHRDRAREFGKYQRRELRGQTAPSSMMVTSGAIGSESGGHRAKRTLLAAALKRANKETERRRATSARGDLISNARRALSMKNAADTDQHGWPATRTANEGMESTPNPDIAPSGALEQEGHRPVLERSRKVR